MSICHAEYTHLKPERYTWYGHRVIDDVGMSNTRDLGCLVCASIMIGNFSASEGRSELIVVFSEVSTTSTDGREMQICTCNLPIDDFMFCAETIQRQGDSTLAAWKKKCAIDEALLKVLMVAIGVSRGANTPLAIGNQRRCMRT